MGFIRWKCGSEIQFHPIKSFTFPGGEEQVQILSNQSKSDFIQIQAQINSSSDLMKLLLTVNALKKVFRNKQYELFMPYLPYARQDRSMQRGEAFSLKVMADLINSCGFSEVFIYDCHSDVGLALINNCYNISQADIMRNCSIRNHHSLGGFQKEIILVAPDGGALKKIYEVAKEFKVKEIITAEKKRDVTTGQITETKIPSDSNISHEDTILVVDDIADGAKTFVELGKVLQKHRPKNLVLYVTHGIFSKGFDELFLHYDHIITTNSFRDLKEESEKYTSKLTVLNIWGQQ